MSIDRNHNYFIFSYISILLIVTALLCGSLKSKASQPFKKPTIVEIVYSNNKERENLRTFFFAQGMLDMDHVYEWKNHFVLYDGGKLWYDVIKSKFTTCKVKLYDKPFYDFERSRCSDQKVAKHWDNIILTANLVADPKKEKEYLEYHRTQFEKWPEVSQGFCNANFQQLLVFKNGRQLMLIISIPKGESLDKLNPLTTKNNPRVDEWNKIMAKYQEGIEGTKPGETWVFLKQYSK